ncbi:MAG: TonB-dependent receptor [Bacteroidales bacterium]|nr:TonB-dependent receptor [Bacteroidales bacterium]
MQRSIVIAFILSLLTGTSLSQGIQDSVFAVPPVSISPGDIFRPDRAGMKETKIDSLIILEKINASLSDLLSENSTVFIKNHGRGALATASFRGTAPSHTQVSWNGININTPMAGMVDFSLIPVYIIDAMSLKHGAASVEDRSGGLGGSVNITNSADWSNSFSGRYMQGIGSYSSFDEYLQLSAGNSVIQWGGRAYHNYSKNDYTFINRSIGNIDPVTGDISHPTDTNENADYRRYGMMQELYLRAGSRDFLSARWWGQKAYRTIPQATSYEGPDNSNLNRQWDTDHRFSADWKHFGDSSTLELHTGLSLKQLDYILKNIVYGRGMIPVIYSESSQSSFMNRATYTRELSKGFSIKASLNANIYNVSTADTVQKTGYDRQRTELSAFLSLQKQFAGRLNLRLMLRQDLVDNEYIPLIPYLGFDLLLAEEGELVLKGNIAGNYHLPSLNDLYWVPGGNPDLLPEEGYSMELGLEGRHLFGDHSVEGELTAYRTDTDNWILWIPGFKGYWEPRNISRVLSQGIELSAGMKGQAGRLGYSLSGTYAYTSSVNYGDKNIWGDESYGKQLVYIPLHSGNIMIRLIYRHYTLGWQHNSYSERYTTSSNDVSRRDRLYPYFMNTLTVGRELELKNISLSAELKVHNLFNESYHSILYRPMPGRNYMLLLMVKF